MEKQKTENHNDKYIVFYEFEDVMDANDTDTADGQREPIPKKG